MARRDAVVRAERLRQRQRSLVRLSLGSLRGVERPAPQVAAAALAALQLLVGREPRAVRVVQAQRARQAVLWPLVDRAVPGAQAQAAVAVAVARH